MYLITGPNTNMIGLYYLPLATLCHETGSDFNGALQALQSLSEVGFAYYDEVEEVVWVPEMARFQIDETLKPSDYRVIGVARELAQFKKSNFFKPFYEKYEKAFLLDSEKCAEILGSPLEAPLEPPGSQEQEQEQEQEQKKEKINKKEKEEISAAEKPAKKGQATEAEKKDKGEVYLSAKKRPLSGRVLREFLEFTKIFAYNKGKPEAADSWLNIVWPKDEAGHAALYADILEGARLEAAARPNLIARGSNPKWMQGWISVRRWEYWLEQKTQAPNGATPSSSPITCPKCAERKPVPRFQHWESFLDEQLFKEHLYSAYGVDEGGKIFQQNVAWFRTRRSILDMHTETQHDEHLTNGHGTTDPGIFDDALPRLESLGALRLQPQPTADLRKAL
jgi:hypothetical protein